MNFLFRKAALFVSCGACLTLSAAHGAEPSKAMDLARQLNDAFIQVAESVQPTVVVVRVATKQSEEMVGEGDVPEEFRRWLERFQGRSPKKNQRNENDGNNDEEPVYDHEGSGVILREEGFILTNNHVVDHADKIKVQLKDGREFDAEIRGTDPDSDIAVIKIKDKVSGLAVATFADSDKVKVGQFAIAVGAPYSLDYSVTVGHVSAKGRSHIMPDRRYADEDYLQTDANINPGNSGGPLLDLNGEVIGINSMIRGLNTGIGFAIPSNLAHEVSDRLITDGQFIRSWLGISIQSLRNSPEMKQMAKGIQDGVVVKSIVPKGPASKSELQAADIITAIEGKPVRNDTELRHDISRRAPGKPVTLAVYRGEKTIDVTVRPEAMPGRDHSLLAQGDDALELNPRHDMNDKVGLEVKTMSKAVAKENGVDFVEGVLVTDVAPKGLGAKFGLKQGDIVIDVNHRKVTNEKEFHEAVGGSKGPVLVKFIRDGEKQFEILKDRAR
jgi:serine protease Do